jgi:hypothetical protein
MSSLKNCNVRVLHLAIWASAAYVDVHRAGEDDEELIANLALHEDFVSGAVALILQALLTQ